MTRSGFSRRMASEALPGQTGQAVVGAALGVVAPPHLKITCENGWVTLSWDAASGPYALERGLQLSAGDDWQPVETTPIEEGTLRHVSLRPQHPAEFFRLARQ